MGIEIASYVCAKIAASASDKYFGIILGNYRIGLKMDSREVILLSVISKVLSDQGKDAGSVLDNSIFLYGSNMSNSNQHNQFPLPTLVLGGGAGTIRGQQHLVYPDRTPLANLLLTLLVRATTISAWNTRMSGWVGRRARKTASGAVTNRMIRGSHW